MTLSYGPNNASFFIQGVLQKTSDQLSSSMKRLSSGLRIANASDDPAGLMLADTLHRSSTVATVAIRNANDGISMTSIMDGALDEINNILSRMSELATESANGVYTNSSRSALSSEFLALGSEIQRIATTTDYNSRLVLSNTSSVTLQVGLDSSSNSQITLTGVQGTLQALGIGTAGGSLTYSIIWTSDAGSLNAAANAMSAISNAMASLSSTRGLVAATESRLSHAVDYLTVARDNYSAAESSIRDIDTAYEVAQSTRLSIIQQGALAMLAQANQEPSRVLTLLQ